MLLSCLRLGVCVCCCHPNELVDLISSLHSIQSELNLLIGESLLKHRIVTTVIPTVTSLTVIWFTVFQSKSARNYKSNLPIFTYFVLLIKFELKRVDVLCTYEVKAV